MKQTIAPVGNVATSTKESNGKDKKNLKKKDKGPGFFSRLGGKIKDIFSELKKVSWPSFAKVVKQTAIVLVVVLVFLVVIFGFDLGLQYLLKLVSPS